MKRAILTALVLGLIGLWSLDKVLAIGGRAAGGGRIGGGAAAAARPAGGGAAINRSPTMSRPTLPSAPANLPSAGNLNRPATLPSAPANRPAIGNLNRPATLPATPANRPTIGNLDRPATLPSTPANRPAIGNLDRPAQLPANLPSIGNNLPNIGNNRPNVGNNLPNVGSNFPNIGNNLPGVNNPGAIARPSNPIANPGNRPTASDLGNFLNLPTQLPADSGIGSRLPGNSPQRPTTLPATPGDRLGNIQDNRGQRQENRQQWRSDFAQNAGDRQQQRQDRASNVRNGWHDNWHNFWNDFHNDFGQPGWRLKYPHLARGYFHYNHPYAHGWWTWATVATLTRWWMYPGWGAPVYYDYGYGGNVYYYGDTVYINNEPAYTTVQYAEQATELAQAGADQLESPTGPPLEWLPLGVFALSTSAAETTPTRMFQLAVSKEGVINGTFYNLDTDEELPILGAVNAKTQRASWYVGDSKNVVAETGIYNLTKDEAPVLIHFGVDRTEEYLLVRLDPPPEEQAK